MRFAYNQIQQGQTPTNNLTPDQIERLGEIGFKWKLTDFEKKFEQRCRDLEAFKSEFGRCQVPSNYSVNPSLATWCSTMRFAYKQIQQGQTPKRNLTPDRIEHLEEIGFKWNVKKTTFEQHCHDLEAFKSEFGHCNVPYNYSVNPSLAKWCIAMRCSYNKIQQGKSTIRNLTPDQIGCLEEIGFKWKLGDYGKTVVQRCHDLEERLVK